MRVQDIMKRHHWWALFAFVAAILPTLLVSELLYPHEEPELHPVRVPGRCQDQVWDMDHYFQISCPPGARASMTLKPGEDFALCTCADSGTVDAPDASVAEAPDGGSR